MHILEGKQRKSSIQQKVNRLELFSLLEIPKIDHAIKHLIEELKEVFQDEIEANNKAKFSVEPDSECEEGIISIQKIKPLYTDDIRLLLYFEDLIANKEYRNDVLREHKVYKEIYKVMS